MLGRLGIRQKLALLLLIPLAAVVALLAAFTAERIGDARAAGRTAALASAARDIGGLIQNLQQERLLALGYLAAANLDRGALVGQAQASVDDTAQLRARPETAEVMRLAAPALDALNPVRQAIISRTIGARDAYTAYRDANTALLDALRLGNPPGADPEGLTQLAGLDALMRSNEEASSVGATLVAAAADPDLSRGLLTDAVIADQQHLQRFRQLVAPDLSDLVDTVDRGKAGQRLRDIIAAVSRPDAAASQAQVSDALTAALSYAGLRRLAQDRVAREITGAAGARATLAERTAYGFGGGALLVIVIVVALGVTVSRSIAQPLRRLTQAAAVVAELSRAELIRVADSDANESILPQLAAVEVDSADELGELAAALNRVQATAALLLERQVTARRNVSVMFANIARRTQTLVGRQLSLIAELEQDEQSPAPAPRQRRAGQLSRLDHLATRLRRSADSLLVVSGTIDQVMSGAPTPLVEVVTAALDEIEGSDTVTVEALPEAAVVSSAAADLRLVLAELLENATNFSPPGSRVTVAAHLSGDCHLVIVDHGLGLSQPRLDEENARLLERERLDVAPTSVLGLFVVGRLARRHGLSVRLDHSEGHGITATVRIPARLLTRPSPLARTAAPARPRGRQILDVEPLEDSFPWFVPPRELSASAAPAVGVAAAGVRTAIAVTAAKHAPVTAAMPTVPVPEPPPVTPAGLARRVPGTHMTPDARVPRVTATPVAGGRHARDPEAERAALNDYLSGSQRADTDVVEEAQRPTFAERQP